MKTINDTFARTSAVRAICIGVIAAFATGAAAEMPPIEELTGEQWYGLYMNGQKIGYLVNRSEVGDNDQVQVVQDATFKLNMVGMNQDMRSYALREYDADGALVRIDSKVTDISGVNEFHAVVKGEELHLASEVAGQRSEKVLPNPNETIEDAIATTLLVRDAPAVGTSVTYSLFEPMYARSIESTTTVAEVEQQVFDGVETDIYQLQTDIPMLGLSTVSYMAEDGLLLEDRVAGMLTMRLEPEAVARDVQYQNDVIVSNAATVDERIPNPRTRDAIELYLDGPLSERHLYTDVRQTLRPEADRIYFEGRRLDPDRIASMSLPIVDESVEKWQAPTTLVQSDHPRMIETANEIIGDETDALRAVDLLSSWVYDNVRSTFSARLTNSLEVLNNMEGDCTEHSMLFVGLARAAGIPAREVAGLIYVDDPEPGFYFHQWAKVWVGTWIDVDPTFDQTIADATHIKLSEGDLFEQVKLLPIIGHLNVEVIE